MRRLLAILSLLAVSAPISALAAAMPPPSTAIVSGKSQPITLALNEDRGLVLTATTATGTAIDLTGSTVTLTVKKNPGDADPLISRLCALTTPAAGIATCTIAHSDTDTLPATTRTYSYDIWQTDPSGNQVRLLPASPLTLVQPLWTPDQATTGITPVPITVIGAPAVTGVEGASLTEHADGGVSWQVPNGLPSQTGHASEYLTTDGSTASWAALQCLPTQTGHAGEYLTTTGTDAAWSPIDFSGDVTGTPGAATVTAIQGHAFSATAPTNLQVPQYQTASTAYVPHTLTASDVGAVASVSAGTGLTATGTTNVTMSLPAVGTAGTYAICGGSITTDAEGRVTAASSSSGSPVLLSPGSQQTGDVNISGTVTAGTAVSAPLVDASTTLGIGTSSATTITIGRSGQSTQFNGTIQGNVGLALGNGGSQTTYIDLHPSNQIIARTQINLYKDANGIDAYTTGHTMTIGNVTAGGIVEGGSNIGTAGVAINTGTGPLAITGEYENTSTTFEATTATAGTSGAPPSQVLRYLIIKLSDGTTGKIPVYAN